MSRRPATPEKHGVTFEEAAVALTHPKAYTNPEPRRVGGELAS